MNLSLRHISVGCNQGLNTVSRPNGDCIAFAADNSVAIYDTQKCVIVRMMPGHGATGRITAVEWIDGFIVSGDSNGLIRIYDTSDDWLSSWIIESEGGSAAGVCALGAFRRQGSRTVIVCAAFSNSEIYRYVFDTSQQKTTSRDKFSMNEMIEAIDTVYMAEEEDNETASYLIAMGGVSCSVHLFQEMNYIGALTGHKGWIQSIAMHPQSRSCILLATASQDKRIRIWSLEFLSEPETLDQIVFQGRFVVACKAILTDHVDWVTGLDWIVTAEEKLQLLSCSMDHTMLISEPLSGGEWDAVARVGQISVDGLGFQTCTFLMNGSSPQVLGLAYQGQFQSWKMAGKRNWVEVPTLSGHFGPVKDIAWDPHRQYFVSVSSDQTSRMWAFCVDRGSWYELSRPQIHGYDLTCIAFCPKQDHLYVSGAEEKVLRVFDAPQSVMDRLEGWTGSKPKSKARVAAAYVPELSLTNKTTTDSDSTTTATTDSSRVHALSLPDELAKSLLWPELFKLYGHGYDLLAVACNSAGTLIASSCKARNEEYAGVWLWETEHWTALDASPLQGHGSSVVQLEFSPNDEYLCSVSKDRHVCLYQRCMDSGSYVLRARVKAHRRIIWSCSFNARSDLLATGSRDQTVKVWRLVQARLELAYEFPPFHSAVTAVAFCPDQPSTRSNRLAIGFEDGSLSIYDGEENWVEQCTVAAAQAHTRAVERIRWRDATTFVSCSRDHSIRVYNLIDL